MLKGVRIKRAAPENLSSPDLGPRALLDVPKSTTRSGRDRSDAPRASVADAKPPKSGERIKLPSRAEEESAAREEMLQFAAGLELSRMTPSARTLYPGAAGAPSSSDSDSQQLDPIPYPSQAERRREGGRSQKASPRRSRPAPSRARAERVRVESAPPRAEDMFALDPGPPETGPTFGRPPTPLATPRSDSLDYDAMFEPPTKAPAVSNLSPTEMAPARGPVPGASVPGDRQSVAQRPNVHGVLPPRSAEPTPSEIPSPPSAPEEDRLQVVNPLQAAALAAARQRGAEQSAEETPSRRKTDSLAATHARNQSLLIALLAFLLGMAVVWAFFV